jgi:hypothetical protein
MTENAQAFYAAPSWKQRFWWRLGYGFLGLQRHDLSEWSSEETPGFAVGAISTRIEVHVSFADRLRLLVSGRMSIEASTKTSAPVDRAMTRSVIAIMPPGESS